MILDIHDASQSSEIDRSCPRNGAVRTTRNRLRIVRTRNRTILPPLLAAAHHPLHRHHPLRRHPQHRRDTLRTAHFPLHQLVRTIVLPLQLIFFKSMYIQIRSLSQLRLDSLRSNILASNNA